MPINSIYIAGAGSPRTSPDRPQQYFHAREPPAACNNCMYVFWMLLRWPGEVRGPSRSTQGGFRQRLRGDTRV